MSAARRPSFYHEGHMALRAATELAVHNAGLHLDGAISTRTRMVGRLEQASAAASAATTLSGYTRAWVIEPQRLCRRTRPML